MPELKDVEAKTLAFMTGPFQLIGTEAAMRPSTFREGEEYVVGMYLTVEALKSGKQYRCLIGKKGVTYNRFAALLEELPSDSGLPKLNFTWDATKEAVVISAVKGSPA